MTLRRAVDVEAVGEHGADHGLRGLQRGERHHGAGVVAHVERADLPGSEPIRALGLQEDAPLPPEAVELIDVQTAEEGLHRLVDVARGHALSQRLLAIDVGVDLRHVRRETWC